MRQLLTREARGRRGFTLVELVTVTVVAAILILMGIGWVASLVLTSDSSISQSANSTNATYVTARLGADLLGAVDCNAYGLDVPFYSFSPTQIAFYERVGTTSTTLSASTATTSTTLSANVSVGSATLSVTSTTGLAVGQQIIVGSGSVTDTLTISGVGAGAVQVSTGVTHSYPSGTPVTASGAHLSLNSTAGLTPGTTVTIGSGSTQESGIVSYVSGSTAYLVNALTYQHSSGETVTFPGAIDLVAWRVSNNTLQRTVVTGASTCNPSSFAAGLSTATWVTIANGFHCAVTSSGTGNCVAGTVSDPLYFQPYSGGAAVSGGTIASPLDCTGSGASTCYFDTVGVQASLVGAGGGGTVLRYNQQFPVNLSGSRLG